MSSFADISIRFLADLSGFSSQMQNAQRSIDKVGKKMQSVGKGLTAGISAPLIAIGGFAVDAFAELEGVSNAFERLNDPNLLKDLRSATKGTVSDLELMKSAVQAQNFKIPLEEMATMLDFARRRAKDTGENVDYLVNSIITGIGRKSPQILDNLGISATALKDELGGAAVASASIADVTKVVGKIAREELQGMGKDALTLKETYLQFKTSVTNSLGEIGSILAEGLQPAVAFARDLAQRFADLSPETKKWIVILGGVAAAAGPLLVLAGTVLPAIATGFTLLVGPIGAVVAALTAVGVVIYKNWAPIKQTLIDITNYFVDLYNESTVFRFAVEGIITNFKNLWATAKFVFTAIGTIIESVGDSIKSVFAPVGDLIKALLNGDLKQIPSILADGFKAGFAATGSMVNRLKEDFQEVKAEITSNIAEGFTNALTGRKYHVSPDAVDTEALENKIANSVSGAMAAGLGKGSGGSNIGADLELYDPAELDDFLTGLGARFDEAVDVSNVESFANMLNDVTDNIPDDFMETETERLRAFSAQMEALKEKAQAVGGAVGGAFEDMSNRFVDSLGLAEHGFEGFAAVLVKTVTKLISIALAQSIAQSISGATASGAATGPAAVFTTPAFIATAVGGVLAAFAAIPKFQTGGIVGGNSFSGDRNLVRVNSGELILNLAQQKNLAGQLGGGGAVILQPSLQYSGDGFRIMLDRTNKKRSRNT